MMPKNSSASSSSSRLPLRTQRHRPRQQQKSMRPNTQPRMTSVSFRTSPSVILSLTTLSVETGTRLAGGKANGGDDGGGGGHGGSDGHCTGQ